MPRVGWCLCEALAAADVEQPTLLVDLATLTGAARVALGPDLPALFGSHDTTVAALAAHGRAIADPVWPMPLWSGYDEDLSSRIADLNNVSSGTFAGAIIGALFLRRFVDEGTDWLHVDLYGWNPKDRPGTTAGRRGAIGASALRAAGRRATPPADACTCTGSGERGRWSTLASASSRAERPP